MLGFVEAAPTHARRSSKPRSFEQAKKDMIANASEVCCRRRCSRCLYQMQGADLTMNVRQSLGEHATATTPDLQSMPDARGCDDSRQSTPEPPR